MRTRSWTRHVPVVVIPCCALLMVLAGARADDPFPLVPAPCANIYTCQPPCEPDCGCDDYGWTVDDEYAWCWNLSGQCAPDQPEFAYHFWTVHQQCGGGSLCWGCTCPYEDGCCSDATEEPLCPYG